MCKGFTKIYMYDLCVTLYQANLFVSHFREQRFFTFSGRILGQVSIMYEGIGPQCMGYTRWVTKNEQFLHGV